jgi:SOS response regulatory protein OraA/RecX
MSALLSPTQLGVTAWRLRRDRSFGDMTTYDIDMLDDRRTTKKELTQLLREEVMAAEEREMVVAAATDAIADVLDAAAKHELPDELRRAIDDLALAVSR